MCFNVRLIDHIEPVLVAQGIEVGMIGVVRGAHGIEVELLHQAHVLFHIGARHGMATGWVVLVSVYATDQQSLAVDPQLPAANLHRAKTDLSAFDIEYLALAIFKAQYQGIEIGCFIGPFTRIEQRYRVMG